MRRLRAEIVLVRNSLKKLEKENEALKIEKSFSSLERIKQEEQTKRVLRLKDKENSFMENRRSFLEEEKCLSPSSSPVDSPKRVKAESAVTASLRSIFGGYDGNPHSVIERLNFFMHYFMHELNNCESTVLFNFLDKVMKENTKESVQIFFVFSIRRDVFAKYYKGVFEARGNLQRKLDILNGAPSWISDFVGDLLLFINNNKEDLGLFFVNLSKFNSYSFSKIFNRSHFNRMIETGIYNEEIKYQIIKNICQNKIPDYIDYRNINRIPVDLVEHLYPGIGGYLL